MSTFPGHNPRPVTFGEVWGTNAMSAKIDVVVLFGGRDGSCDPAIDIMRYLDRDRYAITPVRVTDDGVWVTGSDDGASGVAGFPAADSDGGPAAVGPAHAGAAHAGPASAGSASESLSAVLPVLRGADVVFNCLDRADGLLDLLGVPYVDCGVAGGHGGPAFADAVLLAEGFEVASSSASGRRVDISVLEHSNGRVLASPPDHDLDADLRVELTEAATHAFRVLGCTGLVGISFLIEGQITEDGGDDASILIAEIDTRPLLTADAPYVAAWGSTGLTYRGLLDVLIRTGLGRASARRTSAQARRLRSSAPSPAPSAPAQVGITVYGCGQDEAVLFRSMAPELGIVPLLIEEPVTPDNVGLVAGNRCVSVNHKTRIDAPALLALSEAGVAYISTRSIGVNHIDVKYAESVGITVGNIAYSPDSVADYTLMLMLMAVRDMKALIRRTDAHDYRLHETRGKELRDLTVGVVGTGRIGRAVMERLRGFGCRVMSYDSNPKTTAIQVTLDELLQQSDIVTLHTPLNADTFHLLDPRRIEQMRPGAFVINTGRGPLIDTEALVSALENGALGGAALDVIEGEEGIFYADRRDTQIENKALLRLQEMPNVLISPHTAYFTDHALRDTVENSIINCLKFESRDHRG